MVSRPACRCAVPRLSESYGIITYMYVRDHGVAQFHARHGGEEAVVEIATGAVLRGGLAPRQTRLVREWTDLHRVELLGAWRRASSGEPPGTIPACPGAAVSPILAIHHAPSLTADRYDAVVRRLTNGRERLESLSHGGIQGLLFHVAGQGHDGFWVVDLWESQAAVDRFSQRVRPIAQAAGIGEPMKTYSVHNVLAC